MLTIKDAAERLDINRSTLHRWNRTNILVPLEESLYSEEGIAAVADAIKSKVDKQSYQQIYNDASKTTVQLTNTPIIPQAFSIPEDELTNHDAQVLENIDKLSSYHAKIVLDKTGAPVVKPLLVSWVAYLQARFEGSLVADQDTGKLWLEEITDDKYILKELPPISSMLYDASLNWGIDETSTSNKKIEDAMAKVTELVPQINPYAERLEILKDYWDGKERLDTIFQDLLASPQDPEILKLIARTWFNGAIHNWTRDTSDLVFPIMLDINATAQGTGKSFFFNVINGIMTGAEGKADAAVDGDLNDPANIYPQLIDKAVVNDDEHRIYNASHPIGKQSSGSDINAAYKNWITLDTLEWMPKHSNQVKRVPVRYVLGRTSNIAKPYNDNDTTEVDRRFLTVRGGEFNQITQKSVAEYTEYMKQVLGEAMNKFKWDSSKDANMSPVLREAMKIEQIKGSKQGDGWEFINEIMNREISLNFYAESIVDVQAYLAGAAPHLASDWRDLTTSKDSRFVRPRAISGALFKMSQAIGTKTTKDQAEALTFKWLNMHGFKEHPVTDFKWKGSHYQGDFMINEDNDQYNTPDTDTSVSDILAKLPTINPLTTSSKDIVANVASIMSDLDKLNDGIVSDHASEIHEIHESINAAMSTL